MLLNENHASKCKKELKYVDQGCGCDGYHTFSELYDHRIMLFIALCKKIQKPEYYGDARNVVGNNGKMVWRSKLHHGGTGYNGWFIMGINKKSGEQISYHLPLSCWEETTFAETLDRAPEWDGHTSDDVLERLKKL